MRPSYDFLEKRVNELETLLAAKGNKALVKHVTPQPLSREKFQIYNVEELFFKQLLKIHDAKKSIDGKFDYARQYETGTKPDETPLYEPLGELIILAVTYLERAGCDYDSRLLLFEKLNRRNET